MSNESSLQFRVWHNCQIGKVNNFYTKVNSIEEAWNMINTLAQYDIFQYENRIKPDYCNSNGLEYFDEEENDWLEWYDDDGYDIREHFENMEK